MYSKNHAVNAGDLIVSFVQDCPKKRLNRSGFQILYMPSGSGIYLVEVAVFYSKNSGSLTFIVCSTSILCML